MCYRYLIDCPPLLIIGVGVIVFALLLFSLYIGFSTIRVVHEIEEKDISIFSNMSPTAASDLRSEFPDGSWIDLQSMQGYKSKGWSNVIAIQFGAKEIIYLKRGLNDLNISG